MNAANARYRIVAAIDGSDTANIVLEHAASAANRPGGVELHVLRVLPRARRLGPEDAHRRDERDVALEAIEVELRDLTSETLADLAPRSDVRVRLHARDGIPHEEILELADEVGADLLVVGRHGEKRRPVLGSVPERIVRAALCPVVVVQAPSYARRDREEGCEACARVRRESDGVAWFCEAHRGDRRWRTSYLGPVTSPSLRGPGVWT